MVFVISSQTKFPLRYVLPLNHLLKKYPPVNTTSTIADDMNYISYRQSDLYNCLNNIYNWLSQPYLDLEIINITKHNSTTTIPKLLQ